MKLRIGGPVFVKTQDPDELAAAHVAAGYNAAYCPAVPLDDAGALRKTREAFARRDVMLAEASAWCNLLAADPAERARNFDYVCRQLTLADELGAPCCVDYLGTVRANSNYGPDPRNLSPETFDEGVEVIRNIVDAVRPKTARFCLEMMQWIIPDSVECYERLLAAVDRKAFGVHVDPVNLVLTPRQAYNTGQLIREIFHALGPHIVSCHAKDIILQDRLALHFDEARPGQGLMDYRVYLHEISKLGREVPLLLEHLYTPEEYQSARQFILTQCGVPL